MSFGFIVGIEVGHPFLGGSDDLGGVATTQFDTGPMADAIDRMLEILQKCGDWFAVDFHRFLERTSLHSEAENPVG